MSELMTSGPLGAKKVFDCSVLVSQLRERFGELWLVLVSGCHRSYLALHLRRLRKMPLKIYYENMLNRHVEVFFELVKNGPVRFYHLFLKLGHQNKAKSLKKK